MTKRRILCPLGGAVKLQRGTPRVAQSAVATATAGLLSRTIEATARILSGVVRPRTDQECLCHAR